MSRTKEIEVFVDLSAIPDCDGKSEHDIGFFVADDGKAIVSNINGRETVRGKLIIPMLEQKAEITFSQFVEILKDIEASSYRGSTHSVFYKWFKILFKRGK
jgi:hypothetical protein